MRRALLIAVLTLLALPLLVLAAAPPAGPPYPQPVDGQFVYDYAGVLSPATESRAQQIIVGIRERTAAQVVVYTQVKPGATTDSTRQDANDLIDQWGVGRRGFDDGLAILFNMDQSLCHGQVQLYAGPGYAATFLSNEERQQIYENDMLPKLRGCDLDGALLVAMDKIDANATSDHAQTLDRARFINAFVGLVGGPLAFLLLAGWAGWSWLRFGRDPVYLDSPSVLMPAPPPDLTAASGAVVWEGKATRRALTTAMLDLASRGELSFRPESHLLGLQRKTGIQIETPPADDPYVKLNRRRPISDAESYAIDRLAGIAGADGYISPEDLLEFGKYAEKFNQKVEHHVAAQGWFREPPAKATGRWTGRGTLVIVGGIVGLVIAFNLPSSGLLMLSGAIVAAGVVMVLIARAMPQRTMAGAMIYAMLAAYRRTLQKTMEQARSMVQVVEQAGLDWIETPDQATVWGVALGLQREVEDVIGRSAEDAQAGVTTYHPWLPIWYGSSFSSGGSGQGWSGAAPGLFSASAIPDFGGMMSALGSIGNSPSSSGGGGGFGGGGGGGGGGGAGGGF